RKPPLKRGGLTSLMAICSSRMTLSLAGLAFALIGPGCRAPLNHQVDTPIAAVEDRADADDAQLTATRDEPVPEQAVSWLPGRRPVNDLFAQPAGAAPDSLSTALLFSAAGAEGQNELVDCRSDPIDAPSDFDSLFNPDAESGDDGTDCDDSPLPVISLRQDARELPAMLWDDTISLLNWRNALVLGAAAGGAVAVRDNADQRVRRETAEHPLRWGEGSKV